MAVPGRPGTLPPPDPISFGNFGKKAEDKVAAGVGGNGKGSADGKGLRQHPDDHSASAAAQEEEEDREASLMPGPDERARRRSCSSV
jgi:hypothetical protein